MNTTSISGDAVAAAIEVLRSHPAVATAYLLGSAATGHLRGDSDIDIAILPSRRSAMIAEERLALAGTLASIFGRPVDLGMLSTRNVVYAKEAITTGRILFERNRMDTACFAMLTLSMYASLQEARREVLRAYAA